MKKFSKILLVLLTLSLVFGAVFSISASAADSTHMLSASGAAHNRYSDFESGSNTIVPAFAWASGQKGNVYVTNKTDSNGNTYVNYSAKTKGSTSTANIEGWVPVADYGWAAQRNGTSNFGAHDYVTIDFEIGTDMYSYKDGGGVWHTVNKFMDIPEEYRPEAPHTALAYFDGMSININGRGAEILSTAGTANSKESNFAFVYTTQDSATGKWYLTDKNTYAASTAKLELSNELGVYDHFTYVFEVGRTADTARTTGYNFKNTKVYTFLNGEYLCVSDVSFAMDSIAPNAIRFFVPEADRTSLCIDNVAANWYGHREMTTSVKGGITYYKYSTAGTVYESEGYGIDDYITSGDYLTKPLYMCDEVVYGINYSFVGSPAAATLEHLDGTSDNYSNPYAAALNVKAGDFVHMYANFVDFTPTSFDIDEVTFISYEGSTLSLSKEAKEFYKLQHTEDRYTIRLATGGITLNWYDGIGDEPVKSQSLVPFVAPTHDSESLKIHGKVEYNENNATIQILDAWLWDKEGNDKIGDTELDEIFKAHSVEDLNKLLEKGITEVNIYPVYNTLPLMYTIETMDSVGGTKPDFIVQNYAYDAFTTFATLADAIDDIKGEAKVTLYSDIENPEWYIPTSAGAIVNFDLNGHSITSSNYVFAVSEGTEFNLYSTKTGANIEAPVVITSNGIDACTVNIEGENLEVVANAVVGLVGSPDDAANANKIVINVNGGKYSSTESDSSLFMISEMDMVYNITGADITIAPSSNAFSVSGGSKTSAEINVVDSKIVADNAIGSWSNSCKLYIENSLVAGLNLKNSGITLGNYCLIGATEFDVKSIHTTPDATLALASAGKVIVSDVDCTVLTYDPDVSSENLPEAFKNITIDPISWLDPAGEVYATTYWVAGSEIDTSYVSAESFGIDKSIKSNGWFTFAYNSWKKNDTEANKISFSPVAGKIVESLDEVYVSLGISNSFMYNVYIPTPDVEGDYEIVFGYAQDATTGFFDKSGNPITSGVFTNVTVGEESGYTLLTGEIAAKSFAAETVVIKYKVDGVLLEKSITVDIFDYVEKVNAVYACGTDEIKLVYAMLQYKLRVYEEAMGDDADLDVVIEVMDVLASHGTGCKCGEVEYTAPEASVDYSSIASLVNGFAYTLEIDGTADKYTSSYSFSIYFKKDSGVASVSATGATFVKYETDEYVEYRFTGIKASDLAKVIELTVDGKTATYSLAKYIAETDSEIAKAMYVISVAAANQQ